MFIEQEALNTLFWVSDFNGSLWEKLCVNTSVRLQNKMILQITIKQQFKK